MLKQLIDRVWAGGTRDSELYEEVAHEINSGVMDIGLWTKSCSASGGADSKAKARYIELRVSALRQEKHNAERMRIAAQQHRIREASAIDAENQKRMHAEESMRRSREIMSNLEELKKNNAQRIYNETHSPVAQQRRRRKRRWYSVVTLISILLIYPIYSLVQKGAQTNLSPLLTTLMLCFLIWLLLLFVVNKYSRPSY